MILKFLIAVFFFLWAIDAAAQPAAAEYEKRAEAIQSSMEKYFFDPSTRYYKEYYRPDSVSDFHYSYLWPLCALVQASNETESAGSGRIPMKGVLQSIRDYYDPSPPAPAYGSHIVKLKKEDRFYDDNQWIGIACLDAWERTGDPLFLQQGKLIYRFMMTGFDTASGGGLYWKERDHSTKNTCSNGPGIILALQLFKATKEKPYLDTALLLYEWTNRYLLSDKGVYYDNIKLPSRKIDKRTYTYNTGTMLQSNVLLHGITGDARYLREAQRLAESAWSHFYTNGKWPPNAWFNAVLLRGYLALYRYDRNKKYIDAFITDGESRWQERDAANLLGKGPKKQLIEQAAMLEIYARLHNFLQRR